MTAMALFEELRARGVVLEADGGQLRFDGPAEALTERVLSAMRQCKDDLLNLLREERAEAVAELRTLADDLGQRMWRAAAVSDDDWPAYRTQLVADDDRLAAGMRRLGITLKELRWTVATKGHIWQRLPETTAAGSLQPSEESSKEVGYGT